MYLAWGVGGIKANYPRYNFTALRGPEHLLGMTLEWIFLNS